MRGLKYISLYEPSGYGEAARRCLLGLKHAGVDFTWTPMIHGKAWGLWYEPFHGRDVGDPDLQPFCNRPVAYDTVIVHTVPEYFPLWRQKERGKRIIGCTVWETDRPPGHWIPILNSLDGLLVPCRWNKEIFERWGVSVPIHVVPHIADRSGPQPEGRRGFEGDGYTFYTINTWTARKALWSTLTSYLDAFTQQDATLLVIKTTREDFTRKLFGRFYHSTARAVSRLLSTYRRPAKIRLITEELSRDEIKRMHEEGDCYVSLCRSEGWGLGAFDAAASGKPVIMTGFGGQLDYLLPQLAYLIDYDIVPVHDVAGKASYAPDQHWAEPKVGHAAHLMRHVFENREDAGARGAALGEFVRSQFNHSRITATLLEAVSR